MGEKPTYTVIPKLLSPYTMRVIVGMVLRERKVHPLILKIKKLRPRWAR